MSHAFMQRWILESIAPQCSDFTIDHFSRLQARQQALIAALLNLSLQVSAFSTWEKELHKIVFDPRYLLLNSEERKQVMSVRGKVDHSGIHLVLRGGSLALLFSWGG